MDSYLVSAIITTHNRPPGMVLRAVHSALNQTYPNIETIVVDDSDSDFPERAEVERAVRKASEKNPIWQAERILDGSCLLYIYYDIYRCSQLACQQYSIPDEYDTNRKHFRLCLPGRQVRCMLDLIRCCFLGFLA